MSASRVAVCSGTERGSEPDDPVPHVQKAEEGAEPRGAAGPDGGPARPGFDGVDQAAHDSFPASDPPPWTLG